MSYNHPKRVSVTQTGWLLSFRVSYLESLETNARYPIIFTTTTALLTCFANFQPLLRRLLHNSFGNGKILGCQNMEREHTTVNFPFSYLSSLNTACFEFSSLMLDIIHGLKNRKLDKNYVIILAVIAEGEFDPSKKQPVL